MTCQETVDSFPVTIDLTWVGISDIYRNRSFSTELLGGRCRVIDRWRGTGRDADVSGSVSSGITEFTPPGSFQSVEIGNVISGSVVISMRLMRACKSMARASGLITMALSRFGR